MARYLGLLSKDAESAFGIHFPDLPGCVAAGETEDEALSNAAVALRLWSEGSVKLPEPTGLSRLVKQPDVKDDLARGSVIVAIDLITSNRKQRINIMMEPDIIEAANEAARAAGVNRSQLIETAVTRLLGNRVADVRPRSGKS
jgi:predicted RNase H-like HicB family nuclease